jgi:hypothetical protein
MIEDETQTEDSHELALVVDDPKPTLEQGYTFPNPEPTIDKEKDPEAAVFMGEDSMAVTTSNVKERLSSSKLLLTVTKADFDDRNPEALLD